MAKKAKRPGARGTGPSQDVGSKHGQHFAKTTKPEQGALGATITLFTKDKGPLTKRISLNDDGTIKKAQPAFVLFDLDTKDMPATVQIGDYWAALVTVLPALQGVAHLMRRSTSAGLKRRGAAIGGSGGWHAYVEIQDGTDAERFLKTLHARCWLKGMGRIMIGAGGQLLERSIIDRMVGGRERLVFEGPPIVVPPLRGRQETTASRDWFDGAIV